MHRYIQCYSLMCVQSGWTYRCSWTGEGQTQEHQKRNELIPCLHVGHREVTVVAAEAHNRRGQHIRQFQEVQGHQGGQDDGELGRHDHTGSSARTKEGLMFHNKAIQPFLA